LCADFVAKIMRYIEQLKRVKRFYGRICKMNRAQVDYEDDLWSFFQQCWHLKDWIKNDATVQKAVRDSIESELQTCEAIMRVADLANRSKHLELNRPSRRDAKHSGTDVSICIGGPTTSEYVYRISDGHGPEISAVLLAQNAIQEWETLLKGWGVPYE
jgi:hypothetical protein